MKANMATRTPKTPGSKQGEHCTEFQMHKSQCYNSIKQLVDFSEYKLMQYIESVFDDQQRISLEGILKDYKAGKVALAWKAGRPVWIKVTKEHV